MNKEEINKYLTEAMGECWHTSFNNTESLCSCGKPAYCCYYTKNNDFFTWEGFGKLKEWVEVQEWWKEWYSNHYMSAWYFVNPERFATAIYGFLKEREK